MQEKNGNIWDIATNLPDTHIAITTTGVLRPNGAADMGSGIAKQARERYPDIPDFLGALLTIESCGNHVMALPHDLISFPIKEPNDPTANVTTIERSAQELVYLTNKREWQTILLPRPGCGRGGLTWETVRPVLAEILDDRFICVTYSMKETP